MTKAIKTLVLAAAAASLVAISGAPAYAAPATATSEINAESVPANGETRSLPPGFEVADQDGLHSSATGEYIIDEGDLHPGDVIKKVLTLRDLDTDKAKYTLTLNVEHVSNAGPDGSGLSNSQLVFKLDGKTIFTGTFDGKGKDANGKDIDLSNPSISLNLGDYTPGVQRTLEATITIRKDLKMTASSEAIDKWIFKAKKVAPPPKPGQAVPYVLYALAGGMAITIGVLFLLMSKNRRTTSKAVTQRSVIPAGPQFP